MPINLNKEKANTGKIIAGWNIQEYEKYERSKRWYWIAGIIAISLLVYSIISANYLFTLIIVLLCIILFLHDMQEPVELPFAITETGIILGTKFYSYSEFNNFWIIYNPPMVKNLYFLTNNLLKHRLQVPLLDNDPRPIRDFLNKFLKEDLEQEEEPLSDRVNRALRIH